MDRILKHITTKFRMRGFNKESTGQLTLDTEKLSKNFDNVFNIFKKNIETEIELSREGDKEELKNLLEVRNFLNQTLDVSWSDIRTK
jgi:hypothetical protein